MRYVPRLLLGLFLGLGLLTSAVPAAAAAAQAPPPPASAAVDADRWIEIDLAWFDRDDVAGSARAFWQRLAPLFDGVGGWRGVIVNLDAQVDPLLDWPGDLSARIPLSTQARARWLPLSGALKGDTLERRRQWKERFAEPSTGPRLESQPWTYEDLRRVVRELRRVAEVDRSFAGLRVGISVVAWAAADSAARVSWTSKHPEAFRAGILPSPVLDISASLKEDRGRYGAYPNGVPEGTPAWEFFGAQWGSLSKAVGLDALVLRESALLPGQYRRTGPFGEAGPSDPEKAAAWSRATASLVRAVKRANPQALLIGYASGASAVADWRVNCVDLETLAKEGQLDAFIDQTAAGSWNEVGVRENVFWNRPYLGWTYQLAHVLLHAAVLADTRVHHYVVTETFDAREAWDVLHTAPERLRWGIWAYHHAAVKLPGRIKMPAGTYIAWANRGKLLLSDEDVAFLTRHLNEAIRDARATSEVFGATLVYNRPAVEWLMRTDPRRAIGEWLDDQAGTLMKWPVPILSATRLEYLAAIHTDLPIVQTPTLLAPRERDLLVDRMRSGQSTAIFASPAGGIDPEIARLAGIETQETRRGEARRQAVVTTQIPEITAGLPLTFDTYQPFTRNVASEWATPVDTVDGSPTLLVNAFAGKRVLVWDPAELELEPPTEWHDQPLVQRLGSVYPYVSAARALTYWLHGSDSPWVERIAPEQPVSLAAWQLTDGSYRLLLGNLEEGLSDSADLSRQIEVSLPDSWARGSGAIGRRPIALREVWSGAALPEPEESLGVALDQAQSKLLDLRPR